MGWELYGTVQDYNVWFYDDRKLKRIWIVRLKTKGKPKGIGGYYDLSSALRLKGLRNEIQKI